jgi:hypothetical protein
VARGALHLSLAALAVFVAGSVVTFCADTSRQSAGASMSSMA